MENPGSFAPYQTFVGFHMKPSGHYKPVTTVDETTLKTLQAIPKCFASARAMYKPVLEFINAIFNTELKSYMVRWINHNNDHDQRSRNDTTPRPRAFICSKRQHLSRQNEDLESLRTIDLGIQDIHSETAITINFSCKMQTIFPTNDRYFDPNSDDWTARSQFPSRNTLFSIYLLKRTVRFVRWDRAHITEPIDYLRQPHLLIDFFKRFTRLTNEQLGLHEITLANDQEVLLFNNAVEEHDSLAKKKKKVPCLPERAMLNKDNPTCKVSLKRDLNGTVSTRFYLVRKPIHGQSSTFGRDFRTYIAFDLMKQNLVHLTDIWNPPNPTIHAATPDVQEIYSEFADIFQDDMDDVLPHLPNILYASDTSKVFVEPPDSIWKFYQRLSPRVSSCEDVRSTPSMIPLDHFSFTQDLIFSCYDVSSPKHVVQIIRDVIYVIINVFNETGRLHCNVNSTNIGAIRVNGELRGTLNNWENSKIRNPEINPSSSSKARIGTWLFMSAALTHHQTKPHSLMDDIESCFWVLLHISGYNSHFNIHIHTTRPFCSMFEEWDSNRDIDSITYHPDDTAIGGTEKRDFFQKRRFPKDIMTFDSRFKPLGDLIQKLRMYFRELYWAAEGTANFEDPEKLFELQEKKAEHAEEILDIFDKALALDSWDVDSDSDDDDEVSGNDGPGVEDRRTRSWSAARSVKTTKTRKSSKSSRTRTHKEGQEYRKVNPTARGSKKRIREEVDVDESEDEDGRTYTKKRRVRTSRVIAEDNPAVPLRRSTRNIGRQQ